MVNIIFFESEASKPKTCELKSMWVGKKIRQLLFAPPPPHPPLFVKSPQFFLNCPYKNPGGILPEKKIGRLKCTPSLNF
jgi:hypothetical protein